MGKLKRNMKDEKTTGGAYLNNLFNLLQLREN
jgi:hypothetical protein